MKMAHTVLLLLCVAVVISVVAVLLGGEEAGISSLLAGLSCVIPNTVFLFGIHKTKNKSLAVSLAAFYFFEVIKIILTIVFIVAAFGLYKEINWIAFIISFIIVIKSYVFLLSKMKN